MRTALICTAPGAPILGLADAKRQVRLDIGVTEDDDDLNALIDAATAALDGADGWLKRALCTQSWSLVLPGFWHDLKACAPPQQGMPLSWGSRSRIELPLPPLIDIVSVAYYDAAGVDQVLAEGSGYYLVRCGTEPSYLTPPPGGAWPSVQCDRPDAVRIAFRAGYGTPDKVPASAVLVARLLVAEWYENREASARGAGQELPFFVRQLLAPLRITRF